MGLGVLNPKHDEHVPGGKGYRVLELNHTDRICRHFIRAG